MNEVAKIVIEGTIYDGPAQPDSEPPKAPVNWLKNSVSKGLSALVVLHLDGGPSSETVAQTAAVWYRVIKGWSAWDEALDRPRLTTAFLALAGRSTRWPSPSQLREHLPPRVYPLLELPAPKYPPAKAAANLAKIKAMIRGTVKISGNGRGGL